MARVVVGERRGYEHQDAPFERLVDLLNPSRSAAYHPLFQVAFALQNNPLLGGDFAGLGIEVLPAHTGTAKFDLLVNLVETPEINGQAQPLSGFVEYATDLFDRVSVERLVAGYVRVLEAVVADPGGGIEGVEVIDPVDRARVLGGGSGVGVVAEGVSVGELFGVQVRRCGQAVVEGQLCLTKPKLMSGRGCWGRGCGCGGWGLRRWWRWRCRGVRRWWWRWWRWLGWGRCFCRLIRCMPVRARRLFLRMGRRGWW